MTAGLHTYTCEERTYVVNVPAACLTAACGLIVDVHGMTMDAAMEDANTEMRALGEANGYIVVQPNAEAAAPWSAWSTADDALVLDIMDRVAAAFHTDPDRLHVTGFSQGGAMSWRFLCDHAERFASVAPAAACWDYDGSATTECDFTGDQMPSTRVPILYVHGTRDAVVDYACAPPKVEAIRDVWDLDTEEVLSTDDAHTWTRYTGTDGAVLEFITHDYTARSTLLVGHCVPGSDDVDGGEPGQLFGFGCQEPAPFVWGEAVMRFFLDHPRR